MTGAGLGGICVSALGQTAAGNTAMDSAVSVAGGRYVVGGLLPGRYTVRYQACGHPDRYASQWYGGAVVARHAVPVIVAAGRPTALAPVTLRPATQAGWVAASRTQERASNRDSAARKPVISGVVTTSKGKRLSGICVTVSTSHVSGSSASGTTAVTPTRNGAYSFGGFIGTGRGIVQFTSGCGNKGNFAPQWWRFAAKGSKATKLLLRKGSHFTGIDARLGPGAALSGVVKGGSKSAAGLPGVCVQVEGTGPMASVFQHARTGAGGKYVVKGLGTGRYEVDFEPGCGSKGNFAGSSFPRDVAVTDGKTTRGIDGVLPLGGEITGTVTTGAAHSPVAGICVEADGTSGNDLGDFGDFTISRADGSYVLEGLQAGKYTVSFSAGCGNKGSFASVSYDNQVSEFAATVLPVAAGEKVTGIDASMPRGGIITGRVTDSAGHPLGGICVEVNQVADLSEFTSTGLFLVAEVDGPGGSNRAGQYRISDLLPGAYTVSFSTGCGSKPSAVAPQWYSPQGGGHPAAISVGTGTVRGIDARLAPAGTITGVVTTPAGKAARDVCATAVGLSGQAPDLDFIDGDSLPGASNKHGSYQLPDLAPGKYDVEFTSCEAQNYAPAWYKQAGSQASAQAVTVRGGHTRSGIDEKMSAGSTVSGTITKTGGGTLGPRVCVLALDSSGNLVGVGLSGKTGQYAVPHLAPATYSLVATPCEGRSVLAAVTRPHVTVRSAPVKGVNVTLPVQGIIAGTVRGGSPAVPVGGLCVVATPETGDGASNLGFTGANGNYKVLALAPGKYRIDISSECLFGPGGLIKKTLTSPVTVSSGVTTSGIDATLPADGGLAGTVKVAGSPVAGICVLAFPSASPRATPVVAVTGANGSYQLNNLAPRLYVVEFTAGCGAAKFKTTWFKGASSRSAATAIPVSAGLVTPNIDG